MDVFWHCFCSLFKGGGGLALLCLLFLGGGGLALFGSGNLQCWAESLEQVAERFADSRKIDRLKFMDDSAYRCRCDCYFTDHQLFNLIKINHKSASTDIWDIQLSGAIMQI